MISLYRPFYNRHDLINFTGRIINGKIRVQHGAFKKIYKPVLKLYWPSNAEFSFGKRRYPKGNQRYFFEGYFTEPKENDELFFLDATGSTLKEAESNLFKSYAEVMFCLHEMENVGKLTWLLRCKKCEYVINISRRETDG